MRLLAEENKVMLTSYWSCVVMRPINKRNWNVTHSLWAMGCYEICQPDKKTGISLTSYLSCDDIQWVKQCNVTHKLLVMIKCEETAWQRKAIHSLAVGDVIRTWMPWQKYCNITSLTRCFLSHGMRISDSRNCGFTHFLSVNEMPGRKKCCVTHFLLDMGYGIIRIYGRNWSDTHFLLAVQWDLMWLLRWK